MSEALFESCHRKLKVLSTAVFAENEKYIDKFEALSMAAVDTENGGSRPSEYPEMRKLKALATELGHILNEAHIEQQAVQCNTLTEVQGCNESWAELSTARESKGAGDKHEIKAMENALKYRLKHLYDQVSLVADAKASILLALQQICSSYSNSTASIGQFNGVLNAKTKVALVTAPHFEPLLNHRFFTTQEEENALSTVRSIWAGAVLQSSSHTLLAERQLSTRHFHRHSPSTQWLFHVKLGCTAVLLLWALSECINNELTEKDIWKDQTFLIFVFLGDLLLLLFMWGVSMHVWRWAGIDFVRLLQLEDTEIASLAHPEEAVYSTIANIAILFLLAFILFNKAMRGGYFGDSNDLTFAHGIPACLAVYLILRMLYPCQTRRVWLHKLWRVLAAPFYKVSFCDGYVGDLLTSLVRVFIPMCFSVIYVSETIFAWLTNQMSMTTARSNRWLTEMFWYKFGLLPVLTLFPLWIRLLQCLRRSVETGQRWPHIGNALKYTSAIIVISYGQYQPTVRQNPVWVASFVFATLFQFSWDLTQDWGMVVFSPPRRATAARLSSGVSAVDCLLGTTVSFRRTRLLGPLSNYVLVILLNLVLRFSWTLTLMPAPTPADTPSLYVSFMTHLGPLLASAEIVRRMVWGFFRLEHEQLETASKKKAEDVLQPAQQSDEEGLELLSLDRMDVTSSMEVAPAESFVTSGAVSSDELWTEADWLIWLPDYVAESIDTTWLLKGFQEYRTKVRFIEAIIFAATVLFIVSQAALPAFS